MVVDTVISGGQTGADRAGLDAAIDCGIPHGGWCPAGRRASDGTIPHKYALSETEDSGYRTRTEMNVENSDGTIVFTIGEVTPGCGLTLSLCKKHGKPVHHVSLTQVIHLPDPLSVKALECVDLLHIYHIEEWINNNGIRTLNIAGSRESKAPGIYFRVYEILCEVFNG